MATRARRSLRDFDDEAIAAPDPIATPTPAAPAATSPSVATTATKPQQRPGVGSAKARAPKARKTRTAAVQGATTTRTGVYLHPETFDAAKSAYLVDFDALSEAPDSFARWIAAAIDEHAQGTTQTRTAAAEALPEETRTGSGVTRSFELPDTTIAAMNEAIVTDRDHGRYVSRSEFVGHAIRHAVEQARARAGGVLPAPPARLPNKPVR